MSSSLAYYGLILDGLLTTIELTLTGSALAALVAFPVGMAGLSRSVLVRLLAAAYTNFFRGTSFLVQLFWVFYVLPHFGVSLPPMIVGILLLGLNMGAYAAEVVRGALKAVPKIQTEAAIAVNLTKWQRFWHVVLPQAFALMLPSFGNNLVEVLKTTAVISLITINELTFQAQAIRSATGDTLLPYITILLLYFALSLCLTAPIKALERRITWNGKT